MSALSHSRWPAGVTGHPRSARRDTVESQRQQTGEWSLWLRFEGRAARFAAREACTCGESALSYGGLRDRAAAVAAGLMELCNVRTGDRLVLLSGNRIEWLQVSLAIQGAAAVEVPCRPDLGEYELLALLRATEATVALVEQSQTAELLLAHGRDLPSLRRVVVLEAEAVPPRALALDQLERTGRERLQADPGMVLRRQWQLNADSPAAIIHTSGTTAEPKAVLISHANLLHSQQYLPDALGLSEHDRVLLCLPLWHLYGRLMAYVALSCGASIHCGSLAGLDAELRRVQPSCFPAFPPIWEGIHHRILQRLAGTGTRTALLRTALRLSRRFLRLRDAGSAIGPGGRVLRGLLLLPYRISQALLRRAVVDILGVVPRHGIVGDAPLPRQVDEDLRALGLTVLEGYGSTEQIVSCLRRPWRNRPGTIGMPLPQVELHIVGRDLRQVPDGETGQFAVSGPQVCLGYIDDPAAESRAFTMIDGKRFLLTGDLGRREAGGELVFVGRIANVLHGAGGVPVYPEVIENLLRDSPLIERAVVYPRAGGGLGVLVIPEHGAVPAADPVAQLRQEIRRLLDAGAAQPASLPSHFIIAARPLRIDRELTPTLKLRRRDIHPGVSTGREHPL